MTATASAIETSTEVTQTSKGLTLDVYSNRNYRQCSAGGLSETVEQVTLVGIIDETTGGSAATMKGLRPVPKSSQVFTARPTAPAVVLVKRNIGGPLWHVVPLGEPGEYAWYMAGGSYVATSDSRMKTDMGVAFYGALSFHDRNEG